MYDHFLNPDQTLAPNPALRCHAIAGTITGSSAHPSPVPLLVCGISAFVVTSGHVPSISYRAAVARKADRVMRHSYACHAEMNGVAVPVLSRILGHSNVRMTMRYAHLGDRDIEPATGRFGQAIASILGLEND